MLNKIYVTKKWISDRQPPTILPVNELEIGHVNMPSIPIDRIEIRRPPALPIRPVIKPINYQRPFVLPNNPVINRTPPALPNIPVYKPIDHRRPPALPVNDTARYKFVDAKTGKIINNVTVWHLNGLHCLYGLRANYYSKGGIYTFMFKPNEHVKRYTIKAAGYKAKEISILPNTNIEVVELEKEKIIIKHPPKPTGNEDQTRRLRLAKAKAKARIRKIKLLSI